MNDGDMEIKEELRWLFVIYRFGKVWNEYSSLEEAQRAIANIQRNDLRSTQSTAKEKRDDGAITFLPRRFDGGSRKERFAFSGAQPVANAPTELRHSLDTPDARDQFWAQQPTIGRLVGQSADGGEPDVDG